MDLALMVLRVVVGALFVGHGAQKLFGSFGGAGIGGTAEMFEKAGLGLVGSRRSSPARPSSEAAGCSPSGS
jgi:uncharacterized membrane protein YphA (DoxX/SURF4 family)